MNISGKKTYGFRFAGLDRYLAILFLLSVLTNSTIFADDWGPYLGPTFPDETKEADFEFEGGYMPNPVVKPRSAKLLPTGRRSGNASRQVAFDSTLEPGEMIIPQGLLEEDAHETPAAPKALKKKRQALETENGLVAETLPNDPNGKVPAGEFSFDADEYSMNDNGMAQAGIYGEFPVAFDTGYDNSMMMQPFGTGMLDNLTVFGGVSGFKSALDAGRNGNFGFNEGINWAGPATPQSTLSAQLGFRAVQSNVNGNSGVSTKRTRSQYFVTAGVFKRSYVYPIQGGVAFDWFEEDYYGKVKVQQVRCEISTRTYSNLEYGFLGGFGLSKKGNSFIDRREDPEGLLHYGIRSENHYLFFFRKHLAAGGLAEFRGGLTEYGDTILSAFAEFPLNDRLTVNGGFTGMIPKEGRGRNGYQRESWDVSVGFVFYFRGGACSKICNAHRPMFDVAGNGSFFHRIVRK